MISSKGQLFGYNLRILWNCHHSCLDFEDKKSFPILFVHFRIVNKLCLSLSTLKNTIKKKCLGHILAES